MPEVDSEQVMLTGDKQAEPQKSSAQQARSSTQDLKAASSNIDTNELLTNMDDRSANANPTTESGDASLKAVA